MKEKLLHLAFLKYYFQFFKLKIKILLQIEKLPAQLVNAVYENYRPVLQLACLSGMLVGLDKLFNNKTTLNN